MLGADPNIQKPEYFLASEHPLRVGSFTSSNISKLLGIDGKSKVEQNKAYTYIEEKNMERILKRSLGKEINAKALQWGKVCEIYVGENLLNSEYQQMMNEPLVHAQYPFWVGSPDAIRHTANGKVACEIKCPETLKSFFQLVYGGVDGMCNGFDYDGANFSKHKSGDEYYAQTASNAAIIGTNLAEFMVFVPKLSDLPMIRIIAEKENIYWIKNGLDSELTHLPDDHPKAGLNIMPFTIDAAYLEEMERCVVLASKSLITPQ